MPPTLPPPTIPPTLPPPTIPPTLPPPATTPSDPCIPGVTCPPSDAVTCPPNDSGNCVMDSRCPPRNGATPTLLPHQNCYMFYKCDNGKACEHNCPAGLHFNPQLDVCDWPSNACCDPTVPSVPTILPHTNCNMFYKCNNGKACEQNCPAGLHFNAQLSVCDWPSNACCDPTVPCNPPCIPGVTSVPTILPHTNCNMFYKCNNGKACEQNCPAGLHFNAQLSVCDWPSNACCDPTVPCNPPCIPGPTLFAHSACDKFYKCSNRKACEHLCPPGLHFNALQFVCDWPGSAIVGRMFA
uniref:Chitin-binding type-2 domain-containing protein n=1 Tax=Anopheles atroparvus TaxID=41427 RepID=A0AAG5DM87_ANOAO